MFSPCAGRPSFWSAFWMRDLFTLCGKNGPMRVLFTLCEKNGPMRVLSTLCEKWDEILFTSLWKRAPTRVLFTLREKEWTFENYVRPSVKKKKCTQESYVLLSVKTVDPAEFCSPFCKAKMDPAEFCSPLCKRNVRRRVMFTSLWIAKCIQFTSL